MYVINSDTLKSFTIIQQYKFESVRRCIYLQVKATLEFKVDLLREHRHNGRHLFLLVHVSCRGIGLKLVRDRVRDAGQETTKVQVGAVLLVGEDLIEGLHEPGALGRVTPREVS